MIKNDLKSERILDKLLDVVFCVSGNGVLFREAVAHRTLININPKLCIAEKKAASDLDLFCAAHGVAFLRLDPTDRPRFDQDLLAACCDAEADLIALTFDRLLRKELVQAYAGRIINVHMALLPSFKGFRAIEKALASGATFVGATIHVVDEEMDAGPILVQTLVPVSREDTVELVGLRLFPKLRDAWLQTLAWFSKDRIKTTADGRLFVVGGDYATFPTCPATEISFPHYVRNQEGE